MSRQPRVFHVVDLSTEHLPEEVCEQLPGYDGVVAYALSTSQDSSYGWLLWVPADPDEHADDYDGEIPAEVLAIQRYARLIGCDYILLDRDAGVIADLPIWDW